MTMSQVKKTEQIGEVNISKNGIEDLAKIEAQLEQKRKEKEALDAELARAQEALEKKKKEQAEKERQSKLAQAKLQEEEAEFMLAQALEASKKAKQIYSDLNVEEEKASDVATAVKEIREDMVKAAEDKASTSNAYLKWTGEKVEEVGGLDQPEDLEEDTISPKPFICAKHKAIRWIMRNLAWVQAGLLVFFLLVSWGGFKVYESKIHAYNASLDDTQIISEKINPFNDANIQRVFFEKGLEFMDLGLIFVFLLIIAPTVLLYVVPFINAPNNFSDDFNKSLSPWQRVLTVLFLVSALLLYFGLKAVVNTF